MLRWLIAALLLCPAPPALAGPAVLLLDDSHPAVDEASRRSALQALQDALGRELGWSPLQRPSPELRLSQELGKLIERARLESEAFREKQALAILKEGEAIYRAALGPVVSIEPLRDLLLRQARLLVDLNDREELRRVLQRIEVVSPGSGLDAASFPPAVLRLHRTLQRGLRSGQLRVGSNPPGLSVWVDGVRRGETPVQLELLAGEHFVVIGSASQRVGQTLLVAPGEEARLSQQLSDPRPDWLQAARAAGARRLAVLRLPGGSSLELRLQIIEPAGGPDRQLSTRISAGGLRAAVEELVVRLARQLRPAPRRPGLGRQPPRPHAPAPAPAPAQARPFWRSVWFWTLVGAVVAGGAAGTAIAATRDRSGRIHLFLER